MDQILVYSDSLTWGIVPGTRQRLPFDQRWPGVMENVLNADRHHVRVMEDCLNGRRTVWEDPYKPGRNGLVGLAQSIECHSPLALVILMLGTNDFQSMHRHTAWHSAQGMATLVQAVRQAPIEPGMPVAPILVVAPPPLKTPRGAIAPKFAPADDQSEALAEALGAVASELGTFFFDAGTVVEASAIDGVHLDADQHLILGQTLADRVDTILNSEGHNPGI